MLQQRRYNKALKCFSKNRRDLTLRFCPTRNNRFKFALILFLCLLIFFLVLFYSQQGKIFSAENFSRKEFKGIVKRKILDGEIIEKVMNKSQEDKNKIKSFKNKEDQKRCEMVRDAVQHAWSGYEKLCFGKDELNPVTQKCTDYMSVGLTIVDSLDTLWIMGFHREFKRARDQVATELNFDKNKAISFFETTIRMLGGLLSAYDLSGDKIFLQKADELGSKLILAFDEKTGLPRSQINLHSGSSSNYDQTSSRSFLLAEVGTSQLEFNYLAKATGKRIYAEKVNKVFDLLDRIKKPISGLYPVMIKEDSSQEEKISFSSTSISFGALGDSFYEYLLKMWIFTGKQNSQFQRMYLESIESMYKHLYRQHSYSGLQYISEMYNGELNHKMDHLACFVPGMIILGIEHNVFNDDKTKIDLFADVAANLTNTCHQMSQHFASKLAPEYITFPKNKSIEYSRNANYYILRPEALEAHFYMDRYLGGLKQRNQAQDIFNAIEKHSKQQFGYASLMNIHLPNPKPDTNGVMQTFLLAETFKYLYLIFCDSPSLNDDNSVNNLDSNSLPISKEYQISLNKYVFNTEAHLLSIPSYKFK